MYLQYKILWIEDEKTWVESEVEFIEEYLNKYGFILKLENPEKYEEYDFSQFDIIVVDYNLANNEDGQDVIEKIRGKELYTEILFYSQDGEDNVRKIIAKKEKIDGIYCASKDNCTEKLKKLIYTTIRKTQDLNNLRGLVMAETSELDEMMKDILILIKDKQTLTKKVINGSCVECKNPKNVIFKNGGEEIFKFKGSESLGQNIKNAQSIVLYEQVKKYLASSLCVKSINIDAYQNEVRADRINLAHHSEGIKTSTLMKINNTEYNEQKFIDIRNNIQKYKIVFQEIIDSL